MTTQVDVLQAQKLVLLEQIALNTENTHLTNVRLQKQITDLEAQIAALTPPIQPATPE